MALSWALLLLFSYLLGCTPFAYIAARCLRGVDIRTLGDRNSGAANAWRLLGARAGLVVFIADMGKGAAAVFVTQTIIGGQAAPIAAGLAVIAGHNWPAYLGLRGGRGAAALLGVLITLWPPAGLSLAAASAIPFVLSRSAVPPLVFFFVLFPFVAWATGASSFLVVFAVLLMLVVAATHWATSRGYEVQDAPAGMAQERSG